MGRKITNEEFIKRLTGLNNGIEAIQEYAGSNVKIKFKCRFGHTWDAIPNNIISRKSGCPYCSGNIITIGENDMWSVRPDVAVLLKDSNDGYKYTAYSGKKVTFICPECGEEQIKVIRNVSVQGFSCRVCGDGVSYPNKFSRALLKQLPIETYDAEYSPKWAQGYLYDNYFEYNGVKYILEMDGGFHYITRNLYGSTIEERKDRDKVKDRLAIENGIKIIRIDCQQSNCDYIKNNIIKSYLSEIFDLSNIDWELCDRMSQKSLVEQVCNMYQSGICDVMQLKDIFHLNRNTITDYLKRGTILGICSYSRERSREKGNEKKLHPIVMIDGNNAVKYFKGITPCIKEMWNKYHIKLTHSSIIKSCKEHKLYKGFMFVYLDDLRSIDIQEKQIAHIIDTAPLDFPNEDFFDFN